MHALPRNETPSWPVAALQRELEPLLAGLSVEVIAEVDSTNSELMRRIRTGHRAPLLLVAERQSAGRGRQGRTWLISKEAPCGLRVTQLNDRQFRNHLEDCLAFGRPMLIENIEEELDPLLDPVLERRYVKKGAPPPSLRDVALSRATRLLIVAVLQ